MRRSRIQCTEVLEILFFLKFLGLAFKKVGLGWGGEFPACSIDVPEMTWEPVGQVSLARWSARLTMRSV